MKLKTFGGKDILRVPEPVNANDPTPKDYVDRVVREHREDTQLHLDAGRAETATRLHTPRTINGTSFNGTANITTANWGTTRTITIGSTSKSVNGSGNVTWTLAEIGYTLDQLAPTKTGHGRKPLAVNLAETGFEYASEISLNRYIDRQITVSAATGAVTLNFAQASTFALTLTGNVSLSVSNLPSLSNEVFSAVVRITQGSTARSVSWWTGITWLSPGGAPAAPTAGKTIEYILSYDGVTWVGRKGAGN